MYKAKGRRQVFILYKRILTPPKQMDVTDLYCKINVTHPNNFRQMLLNAKEFFLVFQLKLLVIN